MIGARCPALSSPTDRSLRFVAPAAASSTRRTCAIGSTARTSVGCSTWRRAPAAATDATQRSRRASTSSSSRTSRASGKRSRARSRPCTRAADGRSSTSPGGRPAVGARRADELEVTLPRGFARLLSRERARCHRSSRETGRSSLSATAGCARSARSLWTEKHYRSTIARRLSTTSFARPMVEATNSTTSARRTGGAICGESTSSSARTTSLRRPRERASRDAQRPPRCLRQERTREASMYTASSFSSTWPKPTSLVTRPSASTNAAVAACAASYEASP